MGKTSAIATPEALKTPEQLYAERENRMQEASLLKW